MLAAIDPRVRDEAAAILAWLASRADDSGRIWAPVQIAMGLTADRWPLGAGHHVRIRNALDNGGRRV